MLRESLAIHTYSFGVGETEQQYWREFFKKEKEILSLKILLDEFQETKL